MLQNSIQSPKNIQKIAKKRAFFSQKPSKTEQNRAKPSTFQKVCSETEKFLKKL